MFYFLLTLPSKSVSNPSPLPDQCSEPTTTTPPTTTTTTTTAPTTTTARETIQPTMAGSQASFATAESRVSLTPREYSFSKNASLFVRCWSNCEFLFCFFFLCFFCKAILYSVPARTTTTLSTETGCGNLFLFFVFCQVMFGFVEIEILLFSCIFFCFRFPFIYTYLFQFSMRTADFSRLPRLVNVKAILRFVILFPRDFFVVQIW